MKLLTKDIAHRMPALLATDGKIGRGEPVDIVVKYFQPDGAYTWWLWEASVELDDGEEAPLKDVKDILDQVEAAAEGKGQWPKLDGRQIQDVRFFGLVDGQYREMGYVMLSELKKGRGKMGLPIERDIDFRGTYQDIVEDAPRAVVVNE